MKIDYKDIGKRIHDERLKKGISQEHLAELSDISSTHMSNIENGNTKLSLPVLVNIANSLNCNVDILLCGNIGKNEAAANNIISSLLADCTKEEKIIIIDTVKALRNSLREIREKI